jgi:carboxyl-terminal processing protease
MEDDTIKMFRLITMQQKKTRLFLFTLLAAASLFFLVESGILPGIDQNTDEAKSFRILGTAIGLIRNDYVEEPDPGKTMEGAYKGLVNSLDRMSGYLAPEPARNYIEDRKQPIPETGIILYKHYGALPVVTGIRENSPAEEKGVKVGDSIGAINGESTLHMSMIEANLKLKSIQPRKIHIKLIQAEKNQEIIMETRLIPEPPVVFEEETGTSGILKIRNFTTQSLTQFEKIHIPDMINARLPLVLDLRNCDRGGYDAACRFVNLFIQSDDIGFWEEKGRVQQKIGCPEEPSLSQVPLIIWTNQATAGAAEMVTRVLQDHNRTEKIIGLQTPGLTAQNEFFLFDDQSGIILTSSVFHPIKSPELWQEGISPDIRIDPGELSREAYLKATQKNAVD